MHHVEKSLLQNKNNLEALRLRDEIASRMHQQRSDWNSFPWLSGGTWDDDVPEKDFADGPEFSADLPPLPTPITP
jgi:hypothetical protein